MPPKVTQRDSLTAFLDSDRGERVRFLHQGCCSLSM